MIRTQVYLTPTLYQTINQIARSEKRPSAEVIRELLLAGVEKKKGVCARDTLLEVVKIGKKMKLSGPTDLSTNLDEYLYNE